MLRIQRTLPERYSLANRPALLDMVAAAKATLGEQCLILGHHYQHDDIMEFADARGDSFGLSRIAASTDAATKIVFCGVHFMAESADILTRDDQHVFLPDLNAGCSMADMADLDAVEDAWAALGEHLNLDRLMPITYMNSSAALKAFVGRHGGAVCTSSNARAVLTWALEEVVDGTTRADAVLFFPDQHLGRNTGFQLGYTEDEMNLWNPRFELGGLTAGQVASSRLLLWKGHCSVHQRFRPEQIADFRQRFPQGLVLVHPECAHDTVAAADVVGSTDAIIKAVDAAPAGSAIGIATEVHLVNRLAKERLDCTIECLDPLVCPCATMARIDLPHLAWLLEALVAGEEPNRIVVDPETASWAKIALERMLAIV
jgi:quinolinate synthase